MVPNSFCHDNRVVRCNIVPRRRTSHLWEWLTRNCNSKRRNLRRRARKHGFLHAPPIHSKRMVPEGKLPHPIHRRYPWIPCRTLFQDDVFPDPRTFLTSTVTGSDGLWYAKGLYFADTSSKAWGTEDKNSGRDCCYFTGRATEGNALTCISRMNKVTACEGGRLTMFSIYVTFLYLYWISDASDIFIWLCYHLYCFRSN